MTTLEQELSKLKNLHLECIKQLDKVSEMLVRSSTMEDVKRTMLSFQLQHKDAYTLKEVSERASMPLSTIYRCIKEGKLKVKEEEGIKTIVRREDLLNFLTQPPETH